MDYAISSYIPTLASLSSQSSVPRELLTPQILVISQPATPGLSPIPATTLEGKHICAVAPGSVSVLDHTEATVKAFLDALPASNVVHVACHGTQSFIDPMKSAIMLYDGPVPVSRIMRTPLPEARMAFLSACETAMGDEGLPDEVLHLSAAFIFAGFKSVIGTMW
jgi:CHAT domain-containing protein